MTGTSMPAYQNHPTASQGRDPGRLEGRRPSLAQGLDLEEPVPVGTVEPDDPECAVRLLADLPQQAELAAAEEGLGHLLEDGKELQE